MVWAQCINCCAPAKKKKKYIYIYIYIYVYIKKYIDNKDGWEIR